MTWTKRTKPSTYWFNRVDLLLNEDGTFLLWEDGSNIVLKDGVYATSTDWTKRTRPS